MILQFHLTWIQSFASHTTVITLRFLVFPRPVGRVGEAEVGWCNHNHKGLRGWRQKFLLLPPTCIPRAPALCLCAQGTLTAGHKQPGMNQSRTTALEKRLWDLLDENFFLFSPLPFEKPTTTEKSIGVFSWCFSGYNVLCKETCLCSPAPGCFSTQYISFPLSGQKEWPRGDQRTAAAAWAALLCAALLPSNGNADSSGFVLSFQLVSGMCCFSVHRHPTECLSCLSIYPLDQITTVNYTWKVGEIKGFPQSCYSCICFTLRTAEPNSSFKILIFSLTWYILSKLSSG